MGPPKLGPNAIVRRQVEGVEFGLYTDQEVRDRSVVEVKSPLAYDALGTPLPSGLYDPLMGPSSASDPNCVTCGMSYMDCPGHSGHVEFAVPAYHPLLFGRLVSLLKMKCLACHGLRLDSRRCRLYEAKLHLLDCGRIREATELEEELGKAIRDAAVDVLDHPHARLSGTKPTPEDVARASAATDDLLSRKLSIPLPRPPHVETSNERSVRRAMLKEIQTACNSCRKCGSCGAMSPKVRHDAFNKVFLSALSDAGVKSNMAEGIEIGSALAVGDEEGEGRGGHWEEGGYDSEDSVGPAEGDRGEEEEGQRPFGVDDEAEEEEEDVATFGRKKREATVSLAAADDADVASKSNDEYMHPLEVEAQIKLTWLLRPKLCSALFGSCLPASEGYKMFFLRAIPVPPPRFRPPMIMGTMTVEHAQNYYLNGMLTKNERIRELFAMINDPHPQEEGEEEEGGRKKRKLTKSERDQAEAKMISEWIDLQTTVNCYFDSSKDPSAAATENVPNGIRQILEKKEGIFRKHMMGKRVDHACRSVISPDPYIGTNEIGIPLHFARTLTYPTPVSRHNIEEMRKLVKRGPNEYPGAVWAEAPDGRRVNLDRMSESKREAVAARIGVPGRDGRIWRVGRQLRNGDMMLVNRQPTLHKPGIMAHYVRILHNPTQKTIRMHYANCNTYNADYDGDEMNCHFPQSELALAEAKHIAATDLQYIVPTDGSPLRGLIQDHVDAGVKLTSKDTFLERWECMQLMFAALSSLEGLEVMRSDEDIELCPPAIRKPKELWTGKQIITMLLRHLAGGTASSSSDTDKPAPLPGVSVERMAKTPPTAFGESLDEHSTIVRDGELLRGVLDKAAFGSTDFSLVHGVYEAYGPEKAGLLLNSLGRLFTAYLQYYSGHSCRMEDLVLTKEADEERRELVQRVYNAGSRAAKAWADSEGGKVEIELPKTDEPLTPFERASAAAKIGRLLSGREGPTNFANLDGYMQGQLNPLASEMIKVCLPNGLAVPFPKNTFGLMVTTGAKGSTVNQSQVSCALGQQALEGRRVPRLSSGRTLPSFAPYDPNPRADGFIADRFLTGVRPQEYYFHCMAGREGLVDTAVKTSRSGYLQRCLVKHLEELKVSYDGTVRDGEGGVVQFLYGEDGIDPTKAAHLDGEIETFEYMARNHDALSRRHVALPNSSLDVATKDALRAKALLEEEGGSEGNLLKKRSFVKARKLRTGTEWVRGALCRGWYDAVITKRHSHGESFDITYLRDQKKCSRVPLEADLGRCGGRLTEAASSLCTLIRPSLPDPILSDSDRGENGPHRIGSSGACVSERVALSASNAVEHPKVRTAMESANIDPTKLRSLVAAKYASALCDPGEAVGSIAAQSVGEPSTQMTLNTFHLAGCGGANVTLGIPRLREVIMTASKDLKTPTMSVPLHPSVTEREATRLTRYFTKLTLMEVIASSGGIAVTESLRQGGGGDWERAYFVKLRLHPAERIGEAFELSVEDVAKVVSKKFIPKLAEVMKRELKRSATEGDVGSASVAGGYATDYVEDGASDEFEGDGKRGKTKKKKRAGDDDEYEDDVAGEEDGVMGSRFSHRKEIASYGDMDDEEKEIARKLKREDDEMVGDKEDEDAAAVVTDDEGDYGWDDTSALTGNTVKIDKKKDTLILHPLRVDPSAPPLLMVGLVEIAASATLVKSRPKIDEAYVNAESENDRGRCLQTAGVNFAEIWNLENVDHSRLISNDTWAVRYAYGVEAARSNIVEQIRSVFAVYGISVDPRHLSLIADYMTYDGGYKALNRIGMADVGSSFLQMSFETTATFLTEAALRKRKEPLMSPSASIVLGRPIRHGTGAFELFTK